MDVLSVLRVVPPDVLQGGLWNVLPSASRVAFRQTCSSCDAWVRHNLTTRSSVIFNHLYLESLGSRGRSLAQHFPFLRSLTIRQASAGRKPLPYQVVCACLELLCQGSDTPNDSHALRTSFCYVRELVLRDWPSVGSDELALLAKACPCVEDFTVICRTRCFPHCFDIPADLLHALTVHFPHLRRLELHGIRLELALLLIQQPSQQQPTQQQPSQQQPSQQQPSQQQPSQQQQTQQQPSQQQQTQQQPSQHQPSQHQPSQHQPSQHQPTQQQPSQQQPSQQQPSQQQQTQQQPSQQQQTQQQPSQQQPTQQQPSQQKPSQQQPSQQQPSQQQQTQQQPSQQQPSQQQPSQQQQTQQQPSQQQPSQQQQTQQQQTQQQQTQQQQTQQQQTQQQPSQQQPSQQQQTQQQPSQQQPSQQQETQQQQTQQQPSQQQQTQLQQKPPPPSRKEQRGKDCSAHKAAPNSSSEPASEAAAACLSQGPPMTPPDNYHHNGHQQKQQGYHEQSRLKDHGCGPNPDDGAVSSSHAVVDGETPSSAAAASVKVTGGNGGSGSGGNGSGGSSGSGDSGGSGGNNNSILGLRVLSRLTQVESFKLGVVDPPPRLLYDLRFLGCQLRVLKLEVCLVMTPYQEFRRVVMAAGKAVARLESLRELHVELVAWKGRSTGPLTLAWDLCPQCEDEDDDGLIDVHDSGKEEEDEAGEAGGGTEGAVGPGVSLLMAFLRPVIGAARRAQQMRQCGLRGGSDGRGSCDRGRGGTAIRVICLPQHELQFGEWYLLRQLPSLTRLEVGGTVRELRAAVEGSGVKVVRIGILRPQG